MKVTKLFLVLLLSLLCVQLVSADMNIEPFSSDSYNLGDKILLNGEVSYSKDLRANLDLILKCTSGTVQVGAVLLNLKEGEVSTFSNLITLPTNLLGDCSFITNLVDFNGKNLESKTFSGFKLTDQLKTGFEISKKDFQLGDKLGIKGTVTKQDSSLVDGTIVITFKIGSRTLFIDTVEIKNGVVDYSKTLNKVPPGIYNIDILVKDNLGNSKSLLSLFTLSISGSLNLNPTLDKNIYSPGDTLTLTGLVGSSFNKELNNLHLEFDFGNELKKIGLATNKDIFTVSYIIPKTIKTGVHQINIVASDDEGNYGGNVVEYTTLAVPTNLNINLQSNNFDPEQKVFFLLTLLDQAGDQMQENINVGLFDVKNKAVDSKIVRTGRNDSFLLPMSAPPGTWKLVVEGFNLKSQSTFNVKEFKKLNVSLKDKNLVVQNIGNVPYNSLLDIQGNDLIKNQDVKLKVGDFDEIKLDKLFSPGDYNLSLPSLNKYLGKINIPESKSFFSSLFGSGNGNSSNKLSGNVVKNTASSTRRGLLFIALIVLICGIIYLIISFRKGKKNKIDFSSDKGYLMGRKKLEELKSKGIRKDKPKMEFGKSSPDEVEEWKKRMHKSIMDHEKMQSENEFVRNQQKSVQKDKPGLFNMFG